MRAIIIDDEEHARKNLGDQLKRFCPRVKIIGEADAVKTGIELIEKNLPELIFLDIELSDGTGFDVLNQTDYRKSKVIFTTSHANYAIKAIKFAALDYILKPIDPAELSAAVERAAYISNEYETHRLQCNAFMVNTATPEDNKNKKLVIKSNDKYCFLNTADIIRCEADGNYTIFYLNDQSKSLASKTLKEYEILLRETGFFRIHKSHLINTAFVNKLERSRNGNIIMKDQTALPVSPTKKPLLLQMMGAL